jgi:hypothetical protein
LLFCLTRATCGMLFSLMCTCCSEKSREMRMCSSDSRVGVDVGLVCDFCCCVVLALSWAQVVNHAMLSWCLIKCVIVQF